MNWYNLIGYQSDKKERELKPEQLNSQRSQRNQKNSKIKTLWQNTRLIVDNFGLDFIQMLIFNKMLIDAHNLRMLTIEDSLAEFNFFNV